VVKVAKPGLGVVCGNGKAEVTEACDGTDFKDQTCITSGYPGGGDLVCTNLCSGIDTSGCIP
jgi:hypothetical protein